MEHNALLTVKIAESVIAKIYVPSTIPKATRLHGIIIIAQQLMLVLMKTQI